MPKLSDEVFGLDNEQALLVRRVFQFWFDQHNNTHPDMIAADTLWQELGLFAIEPESIQYRCPTFTCTVGVLSKVTGCGSWNTGDVSPTDGGVDCFDCGIWFVPADEPSIEFRRRVAE